MRKPRLTAASAAELKTRFQNGRAKTGGRKKGVRNKPHLERDVMDALEIAGAIVGRKGRVHFLSALMIAAPHTTTPLLLHMMGLGIEAAGGFESAKVEAVEQKWPPPE